MENLFALFYNSAGVSTDTRNIVPSSLYIALKGANFNGNAFAKNAIELGAKYAIVDEIEYADEERIFYTENSLVFLQQLANHHRRQFNIPIIGITGSNGKTSSKELINSVLSTEKNVLATIGNLNNHIGVPLTLLRLTAKHEIAIIEMGANRFKDIEELCSIAEPTHGLITNIGKAHLEGFGDFDGVLKTKKELYDSLSKNKGTIVVNHDDKVLTSILPASIDSYHYGTSVGSEITGELISLDPFVSLRWSNSSYSSPILTTHMIGKYNFYNFLAAIAFGNLFSISSENINQGIINYLPDNNRSQVKKTDKNTLILDCYNANPTSMTSALESFALIPHDNKLFIIGDMLELGDESMNEHEQILKKALELKLTGFTVGPIFNTLNSSAILQKFLSREDCMEHLQRTPIDNALILLKGSRGIGLEKIETYL